MSYRYRVPMRVIRVLGSIVAAYVALCLAALGLDFVKSMSEDSVCTVGTVTAAEYTELLNRAKKQNWTVWPSLSNGLFWPTDKVISPPGPGYEDAAENIFNGRIAVLSPEGSSFDQKLAASHALMRSMNLSLVRTHRVKGLTSAEGTTSEHLYYMYHIAQRRFAPLCIYCFFWPTSDINLHFEQINGAEPILRNVFIRHSSFLYSSPADQFSPEGCPTI
jgi:hypothetical protein